ncbi:unnamed protein product, partial [Mesocestoides corti]
FFFLGVKCDACNANAFQLRRYKCLRCIDFDLCGYCYDNQRETNSHKKTHPTQCLILEGDYNIFYPNRKSDTTTRSYTCPVCGAMGFQVAELGAHVFDQHGSSRVGVICPICVAPLPDDSSGGGGNSNKLHNSFSHHLMDAHHIKRSPTSIEPPDVTMRKSVCESLLSSDFVLPISVDFANLIQKRSLRINYHFYFKLT